MEIEAVDGKYYFFIPCDNRNFFDSDGNFIDEERMTMKFRREFFFDKIHPKTEVYTDFNEARSISKSLYKENSEVIMIIIRIARRRVVFSFPSNYYPDLELGFFTDKVEDFVQRYFDFVI